MKKTIIACEVNKPDLEPIIEKFAKTEAVIWLKSQLHESPEALKSSLQQAIDSVNADECDNIVLLYTFCGGAVRGLKARNCPISFATFEDCVSAMMISCEDYEYLKADSVFVSRGWLGCDRSILYQYKNNIDKYGQKKADRINRILYSSFTRVVYMQCEDEIRNQDYALAVETAQLLNASLEFRKADLSIYQKLISGQEDKNIRMILSGETVI